jgi:hypothetical protein
MDIIRANYEMTEDECDLYVKLFQRAESDQRFYLLKIREEKGWKAKGFESFDKFGESVLGVTIGRLNQLARAAEVQLSIGNDTNGINIPERSLRPLAPLSDEERRVVWAEATAKAEEDGRKLTAKMVQEAVDRLAAEKATLQGQLDLASQRSEDWRQQALAKEKARAEAEAARALEANERKKLQKSVQESANRIASAQLAELTADAENARIDRTELQQQIKQLRKDQDAAVATRTQQALQAQQDEINRREAQLQAIESRIAVLNGRLDAFTDQDRAVTHYTEITRDIRSAMDALSLHLTRAFDPDYAKFLPEPFVAVFERLAQELAQGADGVRAVLGKIDIRQLEVPVHE